MAGWNPEQYLKFEEERTRPCRDLVARIALENPRRIVDLGCGPGNSTAVLAARWPEAQVMGADRSAEMIATARERYPRGSWRQDDLAVWAASEPVDLVFSNAALQWVSDHARVVPHLFAQVAPGGALAWQVPCNMDAPAHRLMRELAASAAWSAHFAGDVREWFVHELPFYYDLLAPRAARIDLWRAEYVHVMEGPGAIVEWYKGTGLRPFLERLAGEAERERFLADYLREIERAYPPQADGRVLFPFLRQFVVAWRG
jgi:trans-aconitate 2-methyltransferase